ncbi:MAG: DUF4395 family protein [Caldilineaceae bacterium]|nr:DUF4395 family protein [Caldilineaceae bacterium]HRJ41082.1 DUF4395 domain-containing protein [Caldilineaceae bacterium]
MPASSPSRIDYTALKVNQSFIIGLLLLAFLLNQPWLVAFVGLVMLVGTVWPQAGLFKRIYSDLLKPAGLLKADPRPDTPAPHLFAQGIGALVLGVAVLVFTAGGVVAGWLLTALVIMLAAINLLTGFCAGCFIYFQLARRGIEFTLPLWRA